MQHAIERVGRPGGSHEGVGRKKRTRFVLLAQYLTLFCRHGLVDEQAYLPVLCIRWHMRGRKASLFIDHLADTVWSKEVPSDPSFWMAHAIAPAWKVQCLAICGTSASAPTPTQLTYRPEGISENMLALALGYCFWWWRYSPTRIAHFDSGWSSIPSSSLGWIRCKMDHNATGVNTMIDQLAEVSNETNQSLGRKRWHTDLKKILAVTKESCEHSPDIAWKRSESTSCIQSCRICFPV